MPLWVDANIKIERINVEELFDQNLMEHDIALHAHPKRNCIYSEGGVCTRTNKDDPAVIRQQMDWYRAKGYPENNGLVSSSVIFRRHTSKIARLNDIWWQEISNYSRRDQLSFNYSACRAGIDYFVIDGHVRKKDVKGFTVYPNKLGDFRNW